MTGDEDADDKLQRKVGQWLETAGHALEMRVARAFRRAGADVHQSLYYPDGETLREVDVVAKYVGGGPATITWSLHVVVECKSSAGKPWVVFVRPTSPQLLLIADDSICYGGVGATRALTDRWIFSAPFDYDRGRVGYAIATAELGSSKGGESANTAYNAVRQLISACYGLLDHDIVTKPELDGLMLPVLVTKAPIFEAALDRDGTLITTRATSSVLHVRPDQEDRLIAVHVMNEEHLHDTFIPALTRLYERFSR